MILFPPPSSLLPMMSMPACSAHIPSMLYYTLSHVRCMGHAGFTSPVTPQSAIAPVCERLHVLAGVDRAVLQVADRAGVGHDGDAERRQGGREQRPRGLAVRGKEHAAVARAGGRTRAHRLAHKAADGVLQRRVCASTNATFMRDMTDKQLTVSSSDASARAETQRSQAAQQLHHFLAMRH